MPNLSAHSLFYLMLTTILGGSSITPIFQVWKLIKMLSKLPEITSDVQYWDLKPGLFKWKVFFLVKLINLRTWELLLNSLQQKSGAYTPWNLDLEPSLPILTSWPSRVLVNN